MENAVTLADCSVSPDKPSSVNSPTHGLSEFINHPIQPKYSSDSLDVDGIRIYDVCREGKCSCSHLIGGVPSQLKPCRAAPYLFGPSSLDSITEEEKDFLWRGLVGGFDIEDENCQSAYNCQNYDSILDEKFYPATNLKSIPNEQTDFYIKPRKAAVICFASNGPLTMAPSNDRRTN